MTMLRLRIVGLGSLDMGDDALGLLVARRLRERVPAGVEVVEDTSGGARIDQWCDGVRNLMLVDAALVVPPFRAGEMLRLEYPSQRDQFRSVRARSTHSFPIEQALDLAALVGRLPSRVILHLLFAERFLPGTDVSPSMDGPIERLVEFLEQEASFLAEG